MGGRSLLELNATAKPTSLKLFLTKPEGSWAKSCSLLKRELPPPLVDNLLSENPALELVRFEPTLFPPRSPEQPTLLFCPVYHPSHPVKWVALSHPVNVIVPGPTLSPLHHTGFHDRLLFVSTPNWCHSSHGAP